MEIVHDGWLIKSPPEKRIWKAKWRRRWFVLRHSGQIPGQYLLEYYTEPNCKKLKGKIDLDQCEQVDAGLPFDSRKWNCEFMFDIRTPKRIYYLMAETESDMNKWVDCICSVCDLKMHNEDGDSDHYNTENDTMLSPVTDQPLGSNALENASARDEPAPESPSGPYIPISECTTGKAPVTNGIAFPYMVDNNGKSHIELPNEAPPPPPKELCGKGHNAEFYDYPRHIHPPGLDDLRTSPEINSEDLYKVPLLRSPTTPSDSGTATFSEEGECFLPSPLPRPIWTTYPREQHPHSAGHNETDSAFSFSPTLVGSAESDLSRKLNRVSISSSFRDQRTQRNSSHEIYENVLVRRHSVPDSSECHSPGVGPAPPRPPKPPHMIDSTQSSYQNVSVNSQIPPPMISNHRYPNACTYDVPPSSSISGSVGSYLSQTLPSQSKMKGSRRDEDARKFSLTSKVPLPPVTQSMDEMYDFPRCLHDDNSVKLTSMPPAPPSNLAMPRKHSYSNAPAGYMNNSDNVFRYDSKTAEHYRNMEMAQVVETNASGDHNRSPHYTVVTPATPTGAVYTNLPSPLHRDTNQLEPPPPAINRELKPRRVSEELIMHSRSCSSASSTDASSSAKSPSPIDGLLPPAVKRELKPKRSPETGTKQKPITLAPPPICRIGSGNPKRSFRKPRATPSPTSPSHLISHHKTSKPIGKYRTATRSDQSSSEDEQSSSGGSRRNSANDDQQPKLFPSSCTPFRKGPDIQYLDLDLESDAQSVQSPKSPERQGASTVYKTVDFVKTKAFNEMRQNVEETYRKSK